MGTKTGLILSNTGRAAGIMGAIYGYGKWIELSIIDVYNKLSTDFENKAYSILSEFSKEGNNFIDRARDIQNNANSTTIDGMLEGVNIPLQGGVSAQGLTYELHSNIDKVADFFNDHPEAYLVLGFLSTAVYFGLTSRVRRLERNLGIEPIKKSKSDKKFELEIEKEIEKSFKTG
jgi:hypothetical protein